MPSGVTSLSPITYLLSLSAQPNADLIFSAFLRVCSSRTDAMMYWLSNRLFLSLLHSTPYDASSFFYFCRYG